MSHSVLTAIAAVALLIAGDDARGFSWFTYDVYDVVWPTAYAERWLSPTTFPPGSEIESQYLAAMGLWTIVPGASFDFAYGTNDQDYPVDHYDGYSDTIAVAASSLDPGVLGVTYLVNDGPVWFDMDMEFADYPADVGWNFETNPSCDVVADTDTYGINFLLVATHELGHSLGLGHEPIGDEPPGTQWFIATMNPRYPSGGPIGLDNIIELHADDRNGLRYLYPGTTQAQTDLANSGYTSAGPTFAKAVPVFFEPTAAPPGEEVVANATIENFGSTDQFDVRYEFELSTDIELDGSTVSLGYLEFDMLAGDALEFDVAFDVPDVAAGDYYVASKLDGTGQITEIYEDNNDVIYCDTLTVGQTIPTFAGFSQQVVFCDAPFNGPAPQLDFPVNTAPVTFSLDNPLPGMTIDPDTGVINWPEPIAAPFVYELDIRAANAAGSHVETLELGVLQQDPQIVPLADATLTCADLASGGGYVSPQPQLTAPSCMQPILSWMLIDGPPGMSINTGSGIVTWPDPVYSETPYLVTIRAINDAGEALTSWHLSVPPPNGDMDGDGDTDLTDFAAIAPCIEGPTATATGACDCADIDRDGDVDLQDYGLVTQSFGSN